MPPKLALAVGMPTTPAPAGWRWAPLTELARLESGHTPSRKHPEYWGGTIPWISIQDAKLNDGGRIDDTIEHTNELGVANSSARILPENTVCLSRTASVGYVVVMGRQMATSQDFVNWICSEEIDPDFLKYLFVAEGEGLLRFASGAVHPTIYFPEVKAFHVAYPSLGNQRRIVGILDEAFDAIATARENVAQSIYKTREIWDGYLEQIFVEERLGWAKGSLGDFTQLISTGPFGSLLHKSDYEMGGGVPLVNPVNIVDEEIVPDTSKMLGRPTQRRLQGYVLREGDIVVARRGEIGRCAVVRKAESGWVCGTGSFIVRPSAAVDSRFLAHLIRSGGYRRQLERASTGTTIKNLSNDTLKKLKVAVPGLSEQLDIVERIEVLQRETKRLESIYQRKLAALDELKQSLLHQAFTGLI